MSESERSDPSKTPELSAEVLRQLPVQVTWSDSGYEGGLFRPGGPRKVYGEFFSIELQSQGDEALDPPSPQATGGHSEGASDEDQVPPASFGGSINYKGDGPDAEKYVEAGTLTVEEDYRRNGLGERLSKTLAYVAVEQGCTAIKVSFSHPAALKIFRKIFGDNRIQFVDAHAEPIAMSPEDAEQAIVKERAHILAYGRSGPFGHYRPKTDEEIGPGAVKGVSAWVDIKGFDTSGFEHPVQTGVLPGTDPEDETGLGFGW